jgi:hypothetical protein
VLHPVLHVEHEFAQQLFVLPRLRQQRAYALSVQSTVPVMANNAKRIDFFMMRCLSVLDVGHELHQESSTESPE